MLRHYWYKVAKRKIFPKQPLRHNNTLCFVLFCDQLYLRVVNLYTVNQTFAKLKKNGSTRKLGHVFSSNTCRGTTSFSHLTSGEQHLTVIACSFAREMIASLDRIIHCHLNQRNAIFVFLRKKIYTERK